VNARHAAALTLVGWYLMMPPKIAGHYRLNAPLSQWTHVSSYDSADDCENLVTTGKLIWESNPKAMADAEQTKAMAETQCVSTDDPRLKDK
jgi:hypothetical protein